MSQTYTFSTNDQYILHYGQLVISVHDHIADANKAEADALAASGDYFDTLATSLDAISQSLAAKDQPKHLELERIINTLLYMQANYDLTKKN